MCTLSAPSLMQTPVSRLAVQGRKGLGGWLLTHAAVSPSLSPVLHLRGGPGASDPQASHDVSPEAVYFSPPFFLAGCFNCQLFFSLQR